MTQADPARAVRFCNDAADLGCAPAQYNLGVAYLKGEGVGQDVMLSIKWLKKAVVCKCRVPASWFVLQGTHICSGSVEWGLSCAIIGPTDFKTAAKTRARSEIYALCI